MTMERSLCTTSGDDQHARLVVGWFSFTCCEDNTVLFNENLEKDEETLCMSAESIVRAYDPCMSCATNFLKIDSIRR